MSAQAQIVSDTSALGHDVDFKPAALGARARGRITVRRDRGWTILIHRKRFVGDPLTDLIGAPGLWRALPGAPPESKPVPGAFSYVFEIPPGLAHSEGEVGPDEPHPMANLLGWARQTSGGTPPSGDGAAWPTRDEVEGWIEPSRRHVRAGGHLAPIEVSADGARFGLVAPALVRLPDGLSPARVAWVRELCLDAQARWRLVRFSLDGPSVRAEVDLSGAPLERAQALFEIALAALTTAAAWVLPGLAVVADPSVASRCLDQPPCRDASRPHTEGGSS